MAATPSPEFARRQARHFRQCVRESRIAAVAWLLQLAVCSSLVIMLGYVPPDQRPAHPWLLLGIPAWVMWGVIVPWLAQILFAWYFAIRILKDDEPVDESAGDAGFEQAPGRISPGNPERGEGDA